MSYQVLARKWRPARFQEMVGQEHVLKALVNALDDDRLHHAYLFTGTRGVGKTSIARLFAKSLNCEAGVSSSPCGTCSACREISEGRFVDLIEVDAASRTKVEDTRDLLENVQYAPTHGRFKVYLIDEVHMLSTHSFNALLKTLEEPPPHVKFLLATTDPQKLPMTILSRCLQFNLKNMIPERIVEHLANVLQAETIRFEEPALWLLARSADGSMRDALSLTDQAIAFGAGEVNEADVRAMLGTIDQRLVYRMIETLAAQDAKAVLDAVDQLARFSPDYNTVLGDMISLLHRIALAQVVPDAVDNGMGDREQVMQLAAQLTAEDVQLFYQIALVGRKDLPFVPDAREGLEMVLLRMLAFRPAAVVPTNPPPGAALSADEPAVPAAQPPVPPQSQSAPQSPPAPQSQLPTSERSQPAVAASVAIAEQGVVAHSPVAERPAETGATLPAASAISGGAEAESTPSGMIDASNEYDASYFSAAEHVDDDQFMDAAGQGAGPLKKCDTERPLPGAVGRPVVSEISTVPAMAEEVMPWDDEVVAQAPPAQPGVQSPAVKETLPWDDEDQALPAAQESSPSSAVQQPVQPPAVVAGSGAVIVAEPDAQPASEFSALQLEHWVVLVDQLGLTGMTYSIAANTSLEAIADNQLQFHYAAEQKALLSETHIERIRSAIGDYFNHPVEVVFSRGEFTRETPSQYRARKKAERQVMAVRAIETDPAVQAVIQRFNGRIDLGSVEPID